MKGISFETYAILELGASLAHQQFVVVTGGLYVEIKSESVWWDNTLPYSIEDDVSYTVSLEATESDEELGILPMDYIIKAYEMPRLKHVEPDAFPEILETRNPLFNLVELSPLTHTDQSYTNCWTLKGIDLKKWIESKILNTENNKFYMSIQAYVTGFRGMYAITRWINRLKVAKLFNIKRTSAYGVP